MMVMVEGKERGLRRQFTPNYEHVIVRHLDEVADATFARMAFQMACHDGQRPRICERDWVPGWRRHERHHRTRLRNIIPIIDPDIYAVLQTQRNFMRMTH